MPAAKRATRSGSSAGKKKAPARRAAPARKPAKAVKAPARKAAAKPAAKARPAAKPKASAPVARSIGKPTAKSAVKAPGKAVAKAPAKPAASVKSAGRPIGTTTIGKAPSRTRMEAGRTPVRITHFSPTEPLDSNTLIHGIPPYVPAPGEGYMSERQLEHFRQILLAWKRELMEEVDRTVHHMQDEASNFPDPNDRATQESEFGLELRTRDRERKLLKKIDSALERIEDGSYGYCEETGEEIGLKRLEARPVATLSLEAQERREMAERQYGERDDRYR